MYAIDIASKAFEGTTIVKQHRMVNQILKEEIKDMHGLQVNAIQDEHEQVIDSMMLLLAQNICQIDTNIYICSSIVNEQYIREKVNLMNDDGGCCWQCYWYCFVVVASF